MHRGNQGWIGSARDGLSVEQAEAVVDALGLAGGVDLDALVRQVAARSHRPIRIAAFGDERWKNITGVLSRSSELDLILVRGTDSELYRTHSILHELGHILLGDARCAASSGSPDEVVNERSVELIADCLAAVLYRPSDYEDQRVLG